jgi:hypothetical protein
VRARELQQLRLCTQFSAASSASKARQRYGLRLPNDSHPPESLQHRQTIYEVENLEKIPSTKYQRETCHRCDNDSQMVTGHHVSPSDYYPSPHRATTFSGFRSPATLSSSSVQYNSSLQFLSSWHNHLIIHHGERSLISVQPASTSLLKFSRRDNPKPPHISTVSLLDTSRCYPQCIFSTITNPQTSNVPFRSSFIPTITRSSLQPPFIHADELRFRSFCTHTSPILPPILHSCQSLSFALPEFQFPTSRPRDLPQPTYLCTPKLPCPLPAYKQSYVSAS